MVDLRSCMHTISLSYCRTSFIPVVACIACGILPLSEISIRASAHSWLGFVFPFYRAQIQLLISYRELLPSRETGEPAIEEVEAAGAVGDADPLVRQTWSTWRPLLLAAVYFGLMLCYSFDVCTR